ncbi:MAG: macro domain-containing protein [Promethearchaeota archaeon]
MNQLTIKNAIVELFIGELINTEYDAIVLSCNSRLLPSGDVLRKAGAKVQVECNKIIQTISTVSFGDAIITSGGNLGSKYIIHVRAGHEGKKLMLAIWNSLKLADEKGLKSIVFPPILKEAIGFNTKKCAEIMVPTIDKYLNEKNQNLENVSICLENLPDYKDFEVVLDNISN